MVNPSPTWPREGDWPTGSQRGRNLSLLWTSVAEWISDTMGVPEEQVVLREVFILRSWSISARVEAGSSQFVFKANCLRIYDGAPAVYHALSQLRPETTPDLICHKRDPSGLWMLFRFVPGTNVRDLG